MLNGGTDGKATLSMPTTFDFKYTPPYFKTTGFKPEGNMVVQLAAMEFIKLSYSLGAASASVESKEALYGNIGLGSKTSAATTASVVVGNAAAPASQLRQLKSPTFTPGSKIRIQYQYKDLEPNEPVTLYYALSTSSGRFDIMQRRFINSGTGSGVHVAEWTVSWDHKWAGINPKVEMHVRGTHWILEHVSSEPFNLVAFTEDDGIFSSPKHGDVISTNGKISVDWDPSLLHFFRPAFVSQYAGSEEHVEHVYFTINALKVVNGTLLELSEILPIPDGQLPNTGSAALTLNLQSDDLKDSPLVLECASAASSDSPCAYWLQVHCREFGNIFGWSQGYFHIDAASNARASRLPLALKKNLAKPTTMTNYLNLDKSKRQLVDAKVCAAGTEIPIMTSSAFGGKMEKVTISACGFGTDIPMDASVPNQDIGTPVTACASTAPGGGNGGTGGGNGGKGGDSPGSGSGETLG